MVFDVAGALGWAAYAGMLGFLGGRSFQENLWLPLLVSFAIAGLLALVAEGLRRLAMRRKRPGTPA